ncbi:hypothetical protein ACT41M_06050 [Acinetobacter baumannii]|nr:hypothetical protein [Acinetobacter baumannii]
MKKLKYVLFLSEKGWNLTHCEITYHDEINNNYYGYAYIKSDLNMLIHVDFLISKQKIDFIEIRLYDSEKNEVQLVDYDQSDYHIYSLVEDTVEATNIRSTISKLKYERRNRKIKSISFNKTQEANLLKFIESLPDFSTFVKEKILLEIKLSNSHYNDLCLDLIDVIDYLNLIYESLQNENALLRKNFENLKDNLELILIKARTQNLIKP